MPAWKEAVRLSAVHAQQPVEARRVERQRPRLFRPAARLDPAHHARAPAEGHHGEIRLRGDPQHGGDGPLVRGVDHGFGKALDLAAPQAQQVREAAAEGVGHALEGAGPHGVVAAGGAKLPERPGGELRRRRPQRIELHRRRRPRERAPEPPPQLRQQRLLAGAGQLHRLAEPAPAVPAQRLPRDRHRAPSPGPRAPRRAPPITPAASSRATSARMRSSL
jgi:hypothetical protein